MYYCIQDLESLSEGLEGRSSNPVALLADTLLRPNADIGELNPSSLLWKHDPSKAVRHVVIGRGNPGGFWQSMEPNMQVVSLESWLELPLYSFDDWRHDQESGQSRNHMMSTTESRRAFSSEVASYYSDYVTKMGLSANFLDGTEICQVYNLEKEFALTDSQSSSATCMSPLSPASPSTAHADDKNGITNMISWDKVADLCSQISDSEDCGVDCCSQRRVSKYRWYNRGTLQQSDSKVCVFSQKLVLACGVCDGTRCLNVPGEGNAEFLTYRFHVFAERVRDCPESGTVLVVGAGLSAADAVLLALRRDLRVVHIFPKDPHDQQLIFSNMDKKAYPDYKHVHGLMQGKEHEQNYFCYPESQICEFHADGFTISTKSGYKQRWSNVSLGVVAIGSDAKLGFLPEVLVSKLGRSPGVPINAKRNPVDVRPFSFVTEASSSLYAIGSLAGDNFVRFGVGSAVGAAQHILGLTTTIM